jgi:hypothetical protein
MTWQEAVQTVLDMADQNIGELEQLAHDEREQQRAASLRADLERAPPLLAAAPRMLATLLGLRALLATPDFVETIDSRVVAEWVKRIDEVIRNARGRDEQHPDDPSTVQRAGRRSPMTGRPASRARHAGRSGAESFANTPPRRVRTA